MVVNGEVVGGVSSMVNGGEVGSVGAWLTW